MDGDCVAVVSGSLKVFFVDADYVLAVFLVALLCTLCPKVELYLDFPIVSGGYEAD